MHNIKSIREAPIKNGTRVFVRCDLDVALKEGELLETYRLEACLDTLNYITRKGGIPIIAGHLGKPQGKEDSSLSTQIIKPYFSRKINGKFELLENLRFNEGEEKNDEKFALELITNTQTELYVNECFSTSHREHASITTLPKLIPAYAGLHLIKELETLTNLLINPQRPFVVLIGGAKLESKLPTVQTFIQKSDLVLIGGKLGVELEKMPQVKSEKLVIPTDYANDMCDIGPQTTEKYKQALSMAKTVLWAGPMGKYEDPEYIKATKELGTVIAQRTNQKECLSIAGGGDTIAALNQCNLLNQFSFISTGGGAMLEFLASQTLVGIKALENSNKA